MGRIHFPGRPADQAGHALMNKEMNWQGGKVCRGLDRSPTRWIQWPSNAICRIQAVHSAGAGLHTVYASLSPLLPVCASQTVPQDRTPNAGRQSGNPHALSLYLAFISRFSVRKIIKNSIDYLEKKSF